MSLAVEVDSGGNDAGSHTGSATAMCDWFLRLDGDAGVLRQRGTDADPDTERQYQNAKEFRRCVNDPPGAWALEVSDVVVIPPAAWSARVEAVRLEPNADGGVPRQRRVSLEPWPEHCDKGRVCSNSIDWVSDMTLRPVGDIDGDGQPDVEFSGVLTGHVCGDGTGADPDDTKTTAHFYLGVKGNAVRWIPPPRKIRREAGPSTAK